MASLGTGGKRETTEWDDILRAKGIIPEKTVDELAGDVLKGMVEDKIESYDPHESKTVQQLDVELEDADSGEEEVLSQYRERRIRQMQEAAMKRRFGPGVEYVPANDWKAQVTEAGEDVFVVVHLVRSCRCAEAVILCLVRAPSADVRLWFPAHALLPSYSSNRRWRDASGWISCC
jgi:hypothetical protein